MRIWFGLGLAGLGVALALIAGVLFGACPGAVIFWVGVGLLLIGVGIVLIIQPAWPATIVLSIIGIGLVLFGYASATGVSCPILP